MKIAILFVCFLAIIDCKSTNTVSTRWVLLVAGSNGWYNYRHQADVCHAYQVVHEHGIPDENIVVMMYDDLANNDKNPTPGVIINKPNGTDVYKGVLKDYTGEDVTPINFLNILQGKKSAMNGIGSGKVIESGPTDEVFVYFADHGAPGLIAFPDGQSLYAKALQEAITSMHEKKKYMRMVFYIEACESGSMFYKTLPNDISVFATTAANPEESSYACYYDEKRGTYLGDVYSVKWLEDSDKANLQTETLEEQFEKVKMETTTSHCQEYGDFSMKKDPLAIFQGQQMAEVTAEDMRSGSINDAVPSPDVPLMILHKMLETAKTMQEKKDLQEKLFQEEKMRSMIRTRVKQILRKVIQSEAKLNRILMRPAKLKEFDCYQAAVEKFSNVCFKFKKYEYALRYVYTFSNLCDSGVVSTETILTTIEHVCQRMLKKKYLTY